ncbi:MAG: hypothetical protein V1797_21440 [Pseudomonadota bacterium]
MVDEQASETRPACYGVLEKVFPRTAQGLREVQEQCWNCGQRVDCLRAAMTQSEQRRTMNEELIGRQSAVVGGMAGFLQRWSRLKQENQKGGGK